jgi:hypothetical protein
MSDTRIPLTKNQAEAIRAEITEINQLIQAVQIKQAANKRMVDMITRDAEQDPDAFSEHQLEEKNGKIVLLLKPRSKVDVVNGAASEAAASELQ